LKKKIILICFIFTITVIISIISVRKIITVDLPLYVDITVENIEKKINNNETFALYIYQQACAGCSNIKPIINAYIKKNDEEIYAVDLNSTENKSYFAQTLEISATPTIIFFYQGNEKDRIIGIFDYDMLHKKMNDLKKK